MGKASRARRRAEKGRQGGPRGHDGGPFGGRPVGGAGRAALRWLLFEAAGAAGERGDLPAGLRDAVCAVANEVGPGGAGMVVDDLMCECLARIWEAGWQPVEVVRAVRRRRGPDQAELCCTAVAASHTTMPAAPPPPWGAQLAELGADEPWWGEGRDWLRPWALRRGTPWVDAVMVAVETLGVVMSLPATEALMPPPSAWQTAGAAVGRSASPAEEAVLAKVRALLAKAESTNFEHEAEALTAKAQELMARHAIDAALAQSPGASGRDQPSARRIAVDDPYANPKSTLLAAIASANHVRAVWDDRQALMTLVGFDVDLDAVEVLFTSLLVQASRSMLAKGRQRDARGRSRTRSYRQSFLVAFGQRIHERLTLAGTQAREEAERDLGRSLLPVLADREADVDGYTERLFPRLTRARRSSVTSRDGWIAGRVAAEMASLGPMQQRLEAGASG